MPKTDVTAKSLVINKLNKAQYDAATKSDTELYFVPDDTTYEETANKSDSYTVSSSTTYASTKALVDGLNTKQGTITGAASTIVSDNLTASRVLISNASGKVAVDSNVTTTELSYLDGVTSNIQTQFSNMDTAKANKATTLAGYGITNAYTKDEVDEKVAGVYIYKGSVATEDDLPDEDNRTGDVYNVESDGTNWAWNGTSWDNLGALIDLSVKQDVLVSGENIKTINNASILGSGNMSLPVTIAELTDTTIDSLANDQFLRYDSTTSKWKNTTVHIPADANNVTISIKDADNTLLGDFTTDQNVAETITIPTATTSKFGLVKVDSALSDSSTNPVQNKVINTALSGKQPNLNNDQLAAVNSGVTSATVTQVGTNTGAITTINNSAVMNSGITSDLVTTYSTHVANANIHVTSDQKTTWTNKQDALVSGTNIKTINNTSILGSGNIDTNPFPSQTGQSGKFLTTNGSAVSWGSFDESDLVHKTGDESIGGTKTFTGDAIFTGEYGAIVLKDSSGTYSDIQFQESDGSRKGMIRAVSATDANKLTFSVGNSSGTLSDGLTFYISNTDSTNTTATFTSKQVKLPTPTDDNTTSSQGDTVGARNTKLQNYQPLLVSGTNIKTVNGTTLLGSGDLDTFPSQTGNSGKFLTTNGTAVSWAAIEEYTATEVETLWNSITPSN